MLNVTIYQRESFLFACAFFLYLFLLFAINFGAYIYLVAENKYVLQLNITKMIVKIICWWGKIEIEEHLVVGGKIDGGCRMARKSYSVPFAS